MATGTHKTMTSRRLILLAACFAVTLSLQTAHAEQVTANLYEDSFPHIKGNYVVWQGHVDGDWEIFFYDIAARGAPVQITDNDYDDTSPQTDGSYVVWLSESASGGEIFLYDLSGGGAPTAITTDSNVDVSPQIANGRVVWESHQVTTSVQPGEIFLYDILGPAPKIKQLTNNTLDDSSPRINNQSVVWLQADGAGTSTLMIYDLATGVTNPAPAGFVWEDSPQTDGPLTVFTRHDGNDREILVHNKDEDICDQITNNSREDRYPCISATYIAWVGYEGWASEIFVLLFSKYDSDNDNLPDYLEDQTCTHSDDGDTDDDGIPDGTEDANRNGLVDAGETDPCNLDTDADGIQDGTESGYTLADVGTDTNPGVFQQDEDPSTTTDPLNADTDYNGLLDGQEDTDHNGRLDDGETDPGNDPPQADAGGDKSFTEGVTVVLDGSSSFDPDGGALTYQWSQLSGTPVTLTNPQSAQAFFTAPHAGPGALVLSFELAVTDPSGLTDEDTCYIGIREAFPWLLFYPAFGQSKARP